jgi:thioester reductase-like protein
MKIILITGGTGAIGSALVPMFLEENGTQVFLILRARSATHLQERREQLVSFWGRPADAPSLQRLHVLAGDVTQPLLGLEQTQYQKLATQVTHMVHAAGNVRLNQPLEESRRDAMGSAREVTAFADACHHQGQFCKLEYISTVGVAGRKAGVLQEEPLTEARSFHNTYEEAKAEAESFILQRMGEGLPATIHRPSMVVGDSQTGKIIHFQVFYHLTEFCSGTRTWGIVPETGDYRLDIVPADYVARGIYLTSSRQETAGRIFHLCSGPRHAMRLTDLTEQIRQFFRDHGQQLVRLRRVPPAWIRRVLPLVSSLASPAMRGPLQSLPYFLDYLEENQAFENTNSDRFFSKEGLCVPPTQGYLEKVLQYYWDKKQTVKAGVA